MQISNSAVDLIIEEIERRLLAGELKPGDKLPDQHELAAELNVSRPSVREALSALERIGVTESTRGRGTFVTELSFENMTNRLLFSTLTVTPKMANDVMEFRFIMEP